MIWLALRSGNRSQLLLCDWLPKRARWGYFACSGLPERKLSFINNACSAKVVGYWPVLSIKLNTQNTLSLANMQSSGPDKHVK